MWKQTLNAFFQFIIYQKLKIYNQVDVKKIIDTVVKLLCKGGRVNPDYKIFLSLNQQKTQRGKVVRTGKNEFKRQKHAISGHNLPILVKVHQARHSTVWFVLCDQSTGLIWFNVATNLIITYMVLVR